MKSYADIQGDGGSRIVEQVGASHARLARRLSDVRSVIAVSSGKGGVGKSAVTVNLAAAFARSGKRVGVLDGDLQGASVARMLGVRGARPRLETSGVLPAEGPLGIRAMAMDLFLADDAAPLRWKAMTQAESFTWRPTLEMTALREMLTDTTWGALDVLFVDLPPGSDRLPNLAGLLPATAGAVAVTVPSVVSTTVVRRALAAARDAMGARVVGLVDNMAGYTCPHCGQQGPLFPEADSAAAALAAEVPYLGRLPFDPRMAAACDRGTPFAIEEPEAAVSRAVFEVADRIDQWIEWRAEEAAVQEKEGAEP